MASTFTDQMFVLDASTRSTIAHTHTGSLEASKSEEEIRWKKSIRECSGSCANALRAYYVFVWSIWKAHNGQFENWYGLCIVCRSGAVWRETECTEFIGHNIYWTGVRTYGRWVRDVCGIMHSITIDQYLHFVGAIIALLDCLGLSNPTGAEHWTFSQFHVATCSHCRRIKCSYSVGYT